MYGRLADNSSYTMEVLTVVTSAGGAPGRYSDNFVWKVDATDKIKANGILIFQL